MDSTAAAPATFQENHKNLQKAGDCFDIAVHKWEVTNMKTIVTS